MKLNNQLRPEIEQAVIRTSVATTQNAAAATSPETVRSVPIYAEVAVTVRRPRHDVAAVMFNPRHDAAWIGAVRKTRPATLGHLREGAQVAREWCWLAYRRAETTEVVEHVPDRCLAMTTQLPFRLRIRYELEGIPEGTIARVRVRGDVTGLLRAMAPALNALLRRAVIRDLGRLKALLESGAWRSLGG